MADQKVINPDATLDDSSKRWPDLIMEMKDARSPDSMEKPMSQPYTTPANFDSSMHVGERLGLSVHGFLHVARDSG